MSFPHEGSSLQESLFDLPDEVWQVRLLEANIGRWNAVVFDIREDVFVEISRKVEHGPYSTGSRPIALAVLSI
jgi:hypothetical protein